MSSQWTKDLESIISGPLLKSESGYWSGSWALSPRFAIAAWLAALNTPLTLSGPAPAWASTAQDVTKSANSTVNVSAALSPLAPARYRLAGTSGRLNISGDSLRPTYVEIYASGDISGRQASVHGLEAAKHGLEAAESGPEAPVSGKTKPDRFATNGSM